MRAVVTKWLACLPESHQKQKPQKLHYAPSQLCHKWVQGYVLGRKDGHGYHSSSANWSIQILSLHHMPNVLSGVEKCLTYFAVTL